MTWYCYRHIQYDTIQVIKTRIYWYGKLISVHYFNAKNLSALCLLLSPCSCFAFSCHFRGGAGHNVGCRERSDSFYALQKRKFCLVLNVRIMISVLLLLLCLLLLFVLLLLWSCFVTVIVSYYYYDYYCYFLNWVARQIHAYSFVLTVLLGSKHINDPFGFLLLFRRAHQGVYTWCTS